MSRRLYRILLLAYPPAFRSRFAEDMADAFTELVRERRRAGRLAVLALWLRTAGDVLTNAFAERTARAPTVPPRVRRGDVMRSLLDDVKYALRGMRHGPGVTGVVVLTLALAIGASACIFSLVRAVMLRPLPYANPDGLLTIWVDSQSGARIAGGWLGPRLGERLVPVPPPVLHDLRSRASAFSAIDGFTPSWELTLTGSGEAALVQALFVSDGLLDMLGLAPLEGRGFVQHEHVRGGPRAAMVSAGLWTRIGGRGAPDGRSVTLDGEPYTVVGILPESARLPGTPAEIWIPLVHNPFADARRVSLLTVLARVRPGVTPVEAREDLRAVAASLARDFPDSDGHGLALVPLAERVSRRAKPLLLVLTAAVVLLLAIAVANVANMLLARASVRRREVAVRSALGASRWRLLRQGLVESALLALAGAVAGTLLAHWSLASLVSLLSSDLPHGADVRLDGVVLAGTMAIALAAGVLFGIVPALQGSATSASDALREGARAGTGGRRLRQGLVALEVALAFVLLTGSGLLLRSLARLTSVDPGFRTEAVVAAPVALPDARYPTAPARQVFFDRLLASTSAVPGVERTALVNRLPLGGATNNAVEFEIEGRAPRPGELNADRRIATPDYFATMSIPVLAGRVFTAADTDSGPRVAVVNAAFQSRYFGTGSALGSRIRIRLLSGPGPWLTIVGVVADVKHHGLGADVHPEIWVPLAQAPVNGMVLVARTGPAPESMFGAIRGAVHELDPELPVMPAALSQVVRSSTAGPRSRAALLTSFAAVALALAMVGVAGVMAYNMARMRRDIGVRLALGADRPAIITLALRSGLLPAIGGLAFGVAAALAATRLLGSLLFDVRPTDPLTFAAAGLAVLGVALLACLLPAVRASRINPVSVLRVE